MVSYQGKVFVGIEQEILILNSYLTLYPYNFEGQILPITGTYMYVAHDCLLIANEFNQIAYFNGTKWFDINGCTNNEHCE